MRPGTAQTPAHSGAARGSLRYWDVVQAPPPHLVSESSAPGPSGARTLRRNRSGWRGLGGNGGGCAHSRRTQALAGLGHVALARTLYPCPRFMRRRRHAPAHAPRWTGGARWAAELVSTAEPNQVFWALIRVRTLIRTVMRVNSNESRVGFGRLISGGWAREGRRGGAAAGFKPRPPLPHEGRRSPRAATRTGERGGEGRDPPLPQRSAPPSANPPYPRQRGTRCHAESSLTITLTTLSRPTQNLWPLHSGSNQLPRPLHSATAYTDAACTDVDGLYTDVDWGSADGRTTRGTE